MLRKIEKKQKKTKKKTQKKKTNKKQTNKKAKYLVQFAFTTKQVEIKKSSLWESEMFQKLD